VVGVMAKSAIERFLFKPLPVASPLVVGGLAICWPMARHRRRYGHRSTWASAGTPASSAGRHRALGCAAHSARSSGWR